MGTLTSNTGMAFLKWYDSVHGEPSYQETFEAGAAWHAAQAAQPAQEPIRINFDVLYQFSEKNNISYNHLCNAVNDALDDHEALGDRVTQPSQAGELSTEQLLYVQSALKAVKQYGNIFRYERHQVSPYEKIVDALAIVDAAINAKESK